MNKLEDFWKGFYIFNNMQNIGAGWVARFKGYMPSFSDLATKTSALQIALWAIGGNVHINWLFIHLNFKIPDWINWGTIFAFLFTKFYCVIIFNLLIARIGMRKGLLKIDQDIGAKSEELSPVSKELYKTISNIAEKVGAKNEITKLI